MDKAYSTEKGFEVAHRRKKKFDELSLLLDGENYLDREVYNSIQTFRKRRGLNPITFFFIQKVMKVVRQIKIRLLVMLGMQIPKH